MTGMYALVAGILGLTLGSFANVVAYRVPAGISLLRRSRCPSCGALIELSRNIPVLSWLMLTGRCEHCQVRIPLRYPAVEALTGAAFAGLVLLVTDGWGLSGLAAVLVWTAFASFVVVTSVLVQIDLATRRLPDPIVRTGYLLALVPLALAGIVDGDAASILRALAGMAAMYLAYWLIRAARPGGLGGGDVKLAGLAGIYLGWLGWGALAVGWLGGFLLGGAFAVALLATRRVTRGSALAFGPWLLAGAWVGIWFGNSVWAAYAAMCGLIFVKG